MRIRNFVRSYDPRPQRAKCIDPFAKAEHSRLHLPPLDVARGDIVENNVTAHIAPSLLRSEVLTTSLQHDREFEFVVKLLGEVLRINHGLIVADDGIYILKKDNPRHHRM